MARITIEDVERARAGRSDNHIPMNDPYWEVANQYRIQGEAVENENKLSEKIADEKHEDVQVDPEALEQEEAAELGEDEEEEEDDEDDDEFDDEEEDGDVG